MSSTASVEDICLQYGDIIIACVSRVLKEKSSAFRGLINAGLAMPRDGQLPLLVIPPFQHCEPAVFKKLIECLHTGSWTFTNVSEPKTVFYTCVQGYVAGAHWGTDIIPKIALETIKAEAEGIMDTPEVRPADLERMNWFVRAVQLAQAYDWDAKLWQTLWDSGEAMLPKLREYPVFKTWAKNTKAGQHWAKAIGVQF